MREREGATFGKGGPLAHSMPYMLHSMRRLWGGRGRTVGVGARAATGHGGLLR